MLPVAINCSNRLRNFTKDNRHIRHLGKAGLALQPGQDRPAE